MVQSAKVLPDLPPKEPMHDKEFKPAGPKKGIHPTLSRYPSYMPCPPKEYKRKKVVEVEGEAPMHEKGFKLTYRYQSRPCPSVATNFRNLKTSYPAAFTGRF
jgi:hypothetical protein